MSLGLVAYGSSDDDSSEEGNDVPTPPLQAVQPTVAKTKVKYDDTGVSEGPHISDVGPHISDEDEDFMGSRPVSLNLPPPVKTASTSLDNPDVVSSRSATRVSKSVLSALPAPKVLSSGYTVEEDELEDIVKPKELELKNAEKPPNKQRKKIKITVPSLDQYESDDSDDDLPKKKPKLNNQGKIGLFALLPQPKNTSVKAAGRSLIPHSLSKKPKDPPKVTANPLPRKPVRPMPTTVTVKMQSAPQEDSDDDDGDMPSVNFFSFGGDDAGLSTMPDQDTRTSAALKLSVRGTSQSQDAPLLFKSDSGVVEPQPLASALCAGPYMPSSDDPQYNEAYFNQPYYEEEQQQQQQQLESTSSGSAALMPEAELLRLQGKHERGREEINFIDVNVDAKLDGNVIERTKGLTEEGEMVSHSRSKKDQPSSQSKRKHQITYLAHKAKEREFELKNSWAENRLTKRQTQAKYGF